MKVSMFPDLNDPFELSVHDHGDKNVRAKLGTFRAVASKQFGLMCFSDNWTSPVMWAHYADKHNGLCLGFDINDSYLSHVNYVESRLLHRLDEDDFDCNERLIDQMLYYKAVEWAYEREIRAIVLIDGPELPMYHINFGLNMQLREVIIGARNPLSPKEIRPFILPQETSVEVTKARPAFKQFSMVQDRRYKTMTIPAEKGCAHLHVQPRTGPRFIAAVRKKRK
jgi:hypothetical protein